MSRASQQDKFLRVTLRHLATLRDAQHESTPPYPEGWFDLPDRQLADLGAMFFLISLSKYHKKRPLAQIYANLDPPLRLSQYKIFLSNGHPRAFVTWAGLDQACEMRFAIDQIPLRKEQWNSGTSLWVVDLAAPFGHLDEVIKMMAANRQTNRLRTLWHNKEGTRARVIEWTRHSPDEDIAVTSYGKSQFANLLRNGG